MSRTLGQPRNDLLDLLTSPAGQMAARQIDAAFGYASASADTRRVVRTAAARMAKLVRGMDRDQMESCDAELNGFFRMVPFSEALPVAVEMELKWPHHIDTLPEAKQRLTLIQKGGEYAALFSEQKIASVAARIAQMEAGQ
ncbi:hypothetical protein [Paraburkholderia sp. BCC1885]|uniref:hypothetical protein n=1 Tax=Paraburkholderia sp. BCC1885 TaxID=2562669 RepID=UPI001183D0E5|nr:hypothetical protein [Paraburkholderia sp. BCC1885]